MKNYLPEKKDELINYFILGNLGFLNKKIYSEHGLFIWKGCCAKYNFKK